MSDLALIVLAAGMGTRMKSNLPKVLHKVASRSMLGHALAAGAGLNPAQSVIIHGPNMENVQKEAKVFLPHCKFAEQTDRLGTGHAVSMAQKALGNFKGTVLVLYGDVPLIQTSTLQSLLAKIDANHPMAVLGFHAANPFGYGRLITSERTILAIREELDTSPDEKAINLCNSGIIAIDAALLWQLIPKLSSRNAKKELYLTDLVELAVADGNNVNLARCSEDEVAGVNDRTQLAAMELRLQKHFRSQAMIGGATLVDPDTVYFAADTIIGQDVVIEPNVFFGPGVSVGNGVSIRAFSHIEGAVIDAGAQIGPYARLRPGAEIGVDAHIGNFVEIKKAKIGNIGASTITCNYDGYEKHLTQIGEKVFVGSNTSLVAPVKIGDGANIAASSVITADVPADALAMTRPELQIKDGWAKRYRTMKAARKAAKA
jgi:bifunctional UDP-N-acetylglucosamine pyrophosphorylase / glucosamine-1-phosphate N-acetyltransferase